MAIRILCISSNVTERAKGSNDTHCTGHALAAGLTRTIIYCRNLIYILFDGGAKIGYDTRWRDLQ